MLEERVEGHESAVAPSPDPDAGAVDVGSLAEGPRGDRLIPGLQYAELAVDRLSPLATQRRGRPVVVDARHQVPALSEHQMPEIISAPGIVHGGRSRPAVDVEQQR